MATGYTKAELDALLHIMDETVPPIPGKGQPARRVVAMRAAGTEKGVLINVETKGGDAEMFWLNCWVAKELAGAINFASQNYGWAKRGMKPAPSDHLRPPQPDDLTGATEVLSLSTFGEPGGMLVRFTFGKSKRHTTLFFTVGAALEILSYVVRAGTEAAWWDSEDFELIPSRESQH